MAIIAHAESEAHLAYENMPEHLVMGLRGSYAELRFEQRKEQEENRCRLQALSKQYTKVEGMLVQLLQSQPAGRRGNKGAVQCSNFIIPSNNCDYLFSCGDAHATSATTTTNHNPATYVNRHLTFPHYQFLWVLRCPFTSPYTATDTPACPL